MQTYEHLPNFPASSPPPPPASEKNALVFIGGLGDGPHTIPYVRTLAERLFSSSSAAAAAGPSSSYSVFEARLTSAFTAFGYGSLAQDVREIGDLVRYLRKDLGMRKVVLMGHSTGCQDCLEYGTKFLFDSSSSDEEGVRVDGFVLQGPVSDREAIAMVEDAGEVEAALRVAEEMVKERKAGDIMPQDAMPAGWKGSPVTAYRWLSLAGVG
jgi:pimeloyl-ACP methyl ester carboxylesterase